MTALFADTTSISWARYEASSDPGGSTPGQRIDNECRFKRHGSVSPVVCKEFGRHTGGFDALRDYAPAAASTRNCSGKASRR